MEGDLSNFTVPPDTPISSLDAGKSFNGLNTKERLYCHYVSRASWEGAYVCLIQTSPESVPIFLFLRELFSRQTVASLKAESESAVSEEEYKVLRGHARQHSIILCMTLKHQRSIDPL